jgi:hypothetical protein
LYPVKCSFCGGIPADGPFREQRYIPDMKPFGQL